MHSLLYKGIKILLEKGVTTFYFGNMSDFDKSYEDYLPASFEETYFPTKIEKAGKHSYFERNYEMINKAHYCVFYYDENYIPPEECNSGTKIAYEYARKKQKNIINIFKKLAN